MTFTWRLLSLLTLIARWLLALRYRIEVRGLDQIEHNGHGIVFLPNHPALIDPVIMTLLLYPRFRPRSVADEHQLRQPVFGALARLFGARVMPNLERRGFSGVDDMRRVLEETVAGLRAGEHLLLYPAGRIKRRYLEEIGGGSAVEQILRSVPGIRVVLVRQNGLWGSSFSFAPTGRMPEALPALRHGLKYLLLNAIVFMPRRRVVLEFVEPGDFPFEGTRTEINRYLGDFYNARAARHSYVPYGFWERGGTQERPEPEYQPIEGDPTLVLPATTRLVVEVLEQMAGQQSIQLSDHLATDLGLDSLTIAELVAWLEQEFGFSVGTPESLKTVGDVVLAAAGRGISTPQVDLKPPRAVWFAGRSSVRPLSVPAGETITDVFLAQAAARPRQVVVADQTSGERTYRDLIVALLVIAPRLRALPGPHVGIMLPASVGAAVFYLAVLFAGKTPVMINWTTGPRNMRRGLDLLGIDTIITARALLTRLEAMGIDLHEFQGRFLTAEAIRASTTWAGKLGALVRSYTSWGSLKRVRPPDMAVVLFTSGSESLPKAVPLSHRNLLTNVRDVLQVTEVSEADAVIGMLPPFHSFGLTTTVVLPLLTGLRAAYHANPNEAVVMARLIEGYRVTLLFGTPTFLSGIVRVSDANQLRSLSLAVTGAERCPAALYEALHTACPRARILEGYGITECSPVVSLNDWNQPVAGSIGRLLPSVEGVIVDLDAGQRVAPGTPGMLLVRGPSIFSGYLKHDGPSPFVHFEDKDWYRTGDLVTAREDGTLFFRGRLKRFVKLGGEMISLPAIEAALLPHFGEGDDGPLMAVEAIGDPDNPEIALFTRQLADRAMVNGLLRQAGLSPLHNIRQVIHVETIPVLGTGKTDYRALRDLFGHSS